METKYAGWRLLKESINEKDLFELGDKAMALIKDQNENVLDAQDIMQYVLDMLDGKIVPGYAIDYDYLSLYTKDFWKYIGMNISDIDSPEAFYREMMEFFSDCKGSEHLLLITYQWPSTQNGWKALAPTPELKDELDATRERLKSIGCEMEIESSNIGLEATHTKEMGIWSINLKIPVKLDATSMTIASVPKNVVKDFDEFVKK